MINNEKITEFKFGDYDISLKSLNMENNMNGLPKKLTIGMKSDFLNKEKKDGYLFVPISFNILGYEGQKESIDDIQEKYLVKISVIYIVKIEMKDENIDLKDEEENINKLAYFLMLPELRENISSLGSKIGIPGLNVPRKILKVRDEKDGNNN